mmetsp:Transcript_65467/g.150084  ORF Transcript_65467/g.150084 Transcript_65467/m.150084 type:complete len:218 (+) Transcript_65467:68-721(+)
MATATPGTPPWPSAECWQQAHRRLLQVPCRQPLYRGCEAQCARGSARGSRSWRRSGGDWGQCLLVTRLRRCTATQFALCCLGRWPASRRPSCRRSAREPATCGRKLWCKFWFPGWIPRRKRSQRQPRNLTTPFWLRGSGCWLETWRRATTARRWHFCGLPQQSQSVEQAASHACRRCRQWHERLHSGRQYLLGVGWRSCGSAWVPRLRRCWRTASWR